MALNYVSLTLDLYDGAGNVISAGTATFTPSVTLTDTTDHEWIPPAPVTVALKVTGPAVVKLLATDNTGPQPAGWGWSVSFSGVPGNPAAFTFFLPYASGASQYLSSLSPVSSVTTMAAYAQIAGDLGGTSAVPEVISTHLASPLPIAQGGTGSATASAALTALGVPPLDTVATDIAALGVQSAGATGKAADAGHVHPTTGVLTKVADTGSAGFALQNGTPTILTWTAPADGNLHTVILSAILQVTGNETGGLVNWDLNTSPASSSPAFAAGFGVGTWGLGAGGVGYAFTYAVPSGKTVTLAQGSALTAGAAAVYAQIWAA